MELYNPLLIVVDPAHGGRDLGATWAGRMEKDDNLRLGAALRESLIRQGVEPLMTRDTDLYIPLQDRVNLANSGDADLFVSLHRGFSPDGVAGEYGVQTTIYLTAPDVTTGRAAGLVQSSLAAAGVQSDRGVSRGNQFVLRRTRMPALLLEMGFVGNDEDNRLFDANLAAYAEAITRGILTYFDIGYVPPVTAPPSIITIPADAGPCPPEPAPLPQVAAQPAAPAPTVPPQAPAVIPPATGGPAAQSPQRVSGSVRDAQQALNRVFGAGLKDDGVRGPITMRAAVRVIQSLINNSGRGGSVAVDGILGAATHALLPTLRQGDRGPAVTLLQILLRLQGQDPGKADGIFGPRTRAAVTAFQRSQFLVPDGVAGPRTLSHLLR